MGRIKEALGAVVRRFSLMRSYNGSGMNNYFNSSIRHACAGRHPYMDASRLQEQVSSVGINKVDCSHTFGL
jgi:hypothetical protein